MLKRIFLTAFLLGLGQVLFPSCNSCKCPDVSPFFEVAGVGISATEWDGTNPLRYLTANQRYNLPDLTFLVLYEARYYGSTNQPKPLRKGNLWSAAYACDCILPGYEGSADKLTGIQVQTLAVFDADHPAGSSVNDLVLLRPDTAYQPVPLASYFASGAHPISGSGFTFRFSKRPAAQTTVQLRVSVELESGETYFVDSVPFIQR